MVKLNDLGEIWNAKPVVGGHIGWVYVADPNDPTNPAKYSWHYFGKINKQQHPTLSQHLTGGIYGNK